MHATISRLALISSAALTLAALPLAAQQPAARTDVRFASSSAPVVRTVAVYRFYAAHATGLPAQVTIADSAGTLIASFRLRDAVRSYPMMADLSTSGLVLQGETPAGILTIFLYEPGDAGTGATAGHWWLGDQEGELRGRAR